MHSLDITTRKKKKMELGYKQVQERKQKQLKDQEHKVIYVLFTVTLVVLAIGVTIING